MRINLVACRRLPNVQDAFLKIPMAQTTPLSCPTCTAETPLGASFPYTKGANLRPGNRNSSTESLVFCTRRSTFFGNIVHWNRLDTIIPGPISPGDSGMAMMEWNVPPIAVVPLRVRVSIDPHFRTNGTEEDSEDNQSSNELSAPDLTVTQVSAKEVDPNIGLTARISNIGGVRADDVNVVVCYGQQGKPNYDQQITSFRLSIDADSFYDIRYLWEPPTNYFAVYVTADPNSEDDPNGTINEYDEGNNTDFMLVRRW